MPRTAVSSDTAKEIEAILGGDIPSDKATLMTQLDTLNAFRATENKRQAAAAVIFKSAEKSVKDCTSAIHARYEAVGKAG